jgi:hypothetical protein
MNEDRLGADSDRPAVKELSSGPSSGGPGDFWPNGISEAPEPMARDKEEQFVQTRKGASEWEPIRSGSDRLPNERAVLNARNSPSASMNRVMSLRFGVVVSLSSQHPG